MTGIPDPDPPLASGRKEALARWDDEGGATSAGPQEHLPGATGPISSKRNESNGPQSDDFGAGEKTR